MRTKAALQVTGGRGKGGGKGKHVPGLKRVRRVLIDAVHGIARAAINRTRETVGAYREFLG